MPESTQNAPALGEDPFATKANNDKVAASLERDPSLAPVADPLSVSALDELAAAKSKENEAAEKAKAEGATAPVVTPAAADDAAAKKAQEEAAAKAEREAALKQADELFKDAPQLAPNASPKSAEAFSSIKIKAAQEISKLQADLEAARKEATEAKAKAGQPSPEQLAKEKELEDLRQWRLKMDVDFDPRFKEFDSKVSKAHEFIYAQLRKSPRVTEDTIKQIKEYGGPDKCNLTDLFKAMADPTLQRVIEGQISDVVKTQYEKEQAVKSAKENLDGYLEERAKTFQQSTIAHQQATSAELTQFTNALDWFKEKAASEKDTAAEKAAVEDHNKFITALKGEVQAALADDSPRMRATLITGVAQLFNLQRVHAAMKSEFEALQKAHTDLQARWNKVKESGRARPPETIVNPNAAKKPADNFSQRTDDALDSIAKQVMAEKARAGAQV